MGRIVPTIAICASILAVGAMISFAGPLSPPAGLITSTYKTLTEVEPRIAINAANTPGAATAIYRITQPGSYYLTGNITASAGKHAIEIASGHVTLDLSGFTLDGIGAAAGAGGVMVSAVSDVTIRNGFVSAWPYVGVNAPTVKDVHCADLMLSYNGGAGMAVGDNAVVTGCTFLLNANVGLQCGTNGVITECSSRQNSNWGYYLGNGSAVRGCTARENTAHGFYAGLGCSIENCASVLNSGDGINVGGFSLVTRCTAQANLGNGIVASSSGLIEGNMVANNGNGATQGAGIKLSNSRSRADSNNLTGNYVGISAPNGGCFIVRNSVAGSVSTNYDLPGTNTAGAIVAFPGSSFTNTNPWANFSY